MNVTTSSKSGAQFTVTYGATLIGTSFATTVQLHGLQTTGFSSNTTMPIIVVLTSTASGFTWEFEDLNSALALTPSPTSMIVDYITVPIN